MKFCRLNPPPYDLLSSKTTSRPPCRSASAIVQCFPSNLAGVLTFDNQGGWSLNYTFLGIELAAFTGIGEGNFVPSAISGTATATGSYVVGPNGEVGITVTGAISKILTGPPAGLTVTFTNTPPMSGQLSPNNKILLLSVTEPAVETETVSTGSVAAQRICYLSAVAVKIGP